jgi:hypothetical protein
MTRLVVLVGNGLSIAYNPALSVPELTAGTVARFKQLGGTQAGDALRSAARRLGGTDRSDFEALLGPLDTVSTALVALRAASQLALRATETDRAMRRTSQFLAQMYRLGLGETLALVAERARGEGDVRFEATVVAFSRALDQLPVDSPITIANLSYDGLVQAGVLRAQLAMADLADGRSPLTVDLTRTRSVSAHELRPTDDLPTVRVHLLHLHGSIGWLRLRDDRLVKCEIDALRALDYWRRIGRRPNAHTPAVVLTDRKQDAVALEPFALAYRIFGERLAFADRWLIAGYSFGDVPVNQAFRGALRVRRTLGEPDPDVLVIGYGKSTQAIRRQAIEAGLPATSTRTSGLGLPEALGRRRWREWAT